MLGCQGVFPSYKTPVTFPAPEGMIFKYLNPACKGNKWLVSITKILKNKFSSPGLRCHSKQSWMKATGALF